MSRAATTRLKVNPALGSPPSLEFRSVDELLIDEGYQRSLDADASQRLIRSIAFNWDWRLCLPLSVARRDGNKLYVVDGQHRLAAARARGDIAHLPCVISAYAGAGEEAGAFVALNANRRALGALDMFKAAVAAGDANAAAVAEIVSKAGLRFAKHTNWKHWRSGEIANCAYLVKCYKEHGQAPILAALTCMAEAFSDEVLRYNGTMFKAIYLALQVRRAAADKLPDIQARMTVALKRYTQGEWMEMIRHRFALSGDWVSAGSDVLTDVYLGPEGATSSRGTAKAEAAWCAQCDQRVSPAKAAACASSFCSLKAREAA